MIRKLRLLGREKLLAFYRMRYCGGATCISIECAVTGDLWADLTVNFKSPEINLTNEILVKTYSEYEPWVFDLLHQMPDVFKNTGREVQVNMARPQVWQLKQEIPWHPQSREHMIANYKEFWDPTEVLDEFTFLEFLKDINLWKVQRDSDKQIGLLAYQNLPRYYHTFVPI